MASHESNHKTKLVKDLRLAGWYARRIEDQYAVGIGDMIVGIPFGPTVMVEAKMVAHQSFGPTPRQMIELDRWSRRGQMGKVITDFGDPVMARLSWVLGFKNGLMYLHTAQEQVKLEDCMAQTPGEHPVEFFTRFWNQCQKTEK